MGDADDKQGQGQEPEPPQETQPPPETDWAKTETIRKRDPALDDLENK